MADFRIAPFSIYSSSVETGYMADISASFRPHIDLTNMKTDKYGNLNDAPMQGPFTYKYVGGSQYRHVALNEGTDTPSTRPELFHISMSAGTIKVMGPDALDVNRPRAYYFRGEMAKRPLNIENIRQTTGSTIIGNYTHDYDILQTSGRSINNRAFVESQGVGFASSLTTMYVSGAKDPNRTLPNFDLTGTNEYVFVERFNAPGGTDVSSRGVLDTYAEEYAPNNVMTVRNHAVRSVLRSDLTRHTPKATDIPPSLPTEYHTDYRNPKIDFREEPTSSTTTTTAEKLGYVVSSGSVQNQSSGESAATCPGDGGEYIVVGQFTNAGFFDPDIDGQVQLWHYKSGSAAKIKFFNGDGVFGEATSSFGASVSIVSGTDALYILAGTPFFDAGGFTNAGGCGLYKYNVSQDALVETLITASDAANTLVNYGRSVAIASSSDGIRFLIGAIGDDSIASNQGAAYLYHSKSDEPFYIDPAGPVNQKWQIKLTASNGASSDFFGESVDLVSASNGVHMLVGAYGAGSGSAYLYHSKSDEPFYIDPAGPVNQKWQTYITASTGGDSGARFGNSVSMTSGSDAVYMLIGEWFYDGSGFQQGACFLYHSKSSEPFYIDPSGPDNQKWQTRFTASDAAEHAPLGFRFGAATDIFSASDGIHMLVSPGTVGYDRVYLFHSKSDEPFYVTPASSGGELEQEWQTTFRAPSIPSLPSLANQEFGTNRGSTAIFSSSTDGFVPVVGTPGADFDGDLNRGITYIFLGSSAASTTTTTYSQSFDNAFITHEVPRSDLDYRWIHASALTTKASLPGHQNSSSVPYGAYDDIAFVLDSESGVSAHDPLILPSAATMVAPRGDFIGISGSGLDKGGIAVLTPLGSTNFLSKSAGTIFNVYNGPYQYASWNQVRHGYNPLVMQLARESILSLADVPPEKTNLIGNSVRALRAGVTNFKEPNISDNSKPLKHQVAVRPSLNDPNVVTSSFKYTYSNNLSNFTTAQIRNRVGTDLDDTGTLYENISDLYLDMSQLNLPTNPVQKFIDLGYSEVFYPSAMNGYLNRTRTRTNYSEIAGTGSDGYDRIFGKQRTFYKDDEIRTFGTAPNSQGFVEEGAGVVIPIQQLYTFDTFDDVTLSKEASSGVRTDDTSGSEVFCYGTFAGTSPSERFLQFKNSFLSGASISLTFDVTHGTYGTFDGTVTLEQPDTGEDLLVQYQSVATGTTWQTVDTITVASVAAGIYSPETTTFTPTEDVYVRISQTSFSGKGTVNGYSFDNWAIDNLQVTGSSSPSSAAYLNFNPMATDGIRSFPESSSYRKYDGELMGDTDSSMFASTPIPSLSFLELTHILNVSSSDYVERLTEQISGRNPWYDTYEKYADDTRPASKDMSVLPEFRMSEHIPYYILENENNFRAENNKYLTLDGAAITASAATETDSFDVSFMKQYANSGKAEKLYEVADEHRDVSKLSHIKLTCKGIKKLLPYNGFYPQNRSVQLGNLLSESLGSHLIGTHESLAGTYPAQAMQGLLKPLMSPGILYNSIKGGIAVDYPIYTGSVPGLAEGTNTPTDFRLNDGSNYRLPFEALLNLKGALPEGEDNPIRLVSSFVTADNDLSTDDIFKYKFVWDGKKTPLFELGMHNFLAETVDFFLEDGQLSVYQSKPDQQWDEFEADKTYYMDVVLRDEVEMNKFVEYSGEKTVTENFKLFSTSSNPYDYFGNSVSMVSGGAGEGMYALVGAVDVDSGSNPDSDEGAAYLFQNRFDGAGWRHLHTIVPSDAQVGYPGFWSGFGTSVSVLSGSDSIFALIGSFHHSGSVANTGAAYLYKLSQTSVLSELKITASDGGDDDRFGTNVALSFGSSTALYAAIGAINAVAGATADAGAIYAYETTTNLVTGSSWEHKLTASDALTTSGLGFSVGIASGTDGLYVLGGDASAEPGGDTGRGALYLYQITDFSDTDKTTEQILTASNGATNDGLGVAADLVSGSDAVYAVGFSAGHEEAPPTRHTGSGYIFQVTDITDSDTTVENILTSSDAFARIGQTLFASNFLASGSDALYVLTSNAISGSTSDGDPFGASGDMRIFRVPDFSDTDATTEQQMTASDPSSNARLGWSVTLVSGTDSVFAMGGAPYAENFVSTETIPFVGAAYLFTGTVGTMVETADIFGVPQDYKQNGKLFGMALENQYDPGYVAYTPPSFYGEAIARLSFTPTISTKYSLEEIFNNVKVENILTTNADRMATINVLKKSLTTLQNANKMPVSSSINMFGKFFEPSVIYDDNGNPLQVDENEQNKPSWVVSTRFEAPTLDVSSSKYNELYTAHNPGIDAAFEFDVGTIQRTNPRTMWTSYGDVPKGDKGHYFELKQSFPNKLAADDALTGSLIDKCGFNPGSKKIGVVRETKDISEAIVAIPYLENDSANVKTTFIDGKYFIMQDRHQFFIQKFGSKSNVFAAAPLPSTSDVLADVAASIGAGTATAPVLGQPASAPTTTTISNTIQMMKKYVIPPHMDFVKHSDIDPFIMYIFEFKHTLKQKELVDIWQGVMPDSALKIEKDNVVISHDVNPSEFFGNLEDPRVLGDMKFYVFKVKLKGKQNYFELTKDSTDDARFQFVFQGDPTATATPPQGSYNWPYDYFSLVEAAKIEAEITLKNKDEE